MSRKVTETVLASDGDREVRVRLYHESGVIRIVEKIGPHLDDVNVGAAALRAFLNEHLKAGEP